MASACVSRFGDGRNRLCPPGVAGYELGHASRRHLREKSSRHGTAEIRSQRRCPVSGAGKTPGGAHSRKHLPAKPARGATDPRMEAECSSLRRSDGVRNWSRKLCTEKARAGGAVKGG